MTYFSEVIITFTDGRLPYICPNNEMAINNQQRMNGGVIKDIKPYDPNAKPPKAVVREKTYTQTEVDAMLAAAQKPVKTTVPIDPRYNTPFGTLPEYAKQPLNAADLLPKSKGSRPKKNKL